MSKKTYDLGSPDSLRTAGAESLLASVKLRRRDFLGWMGALGCRALPGISALSLGSCGGGGGSGGGSTPNLAAANLPLPASITATSASITVQARRVQLTAAGAPATPNAWVYCGDGVTPATGVLADYLGPTLSYRRGTASQITYANGLSGSAGLLQAPPGIPAELNQTCGLVTLQSDVAIAVHLHGGRVQGGADGWPLAPIGYAGNPYGFPTARTYNYANDQRASMLWYHDHAMDHTAAHVFAGLAGLYFIRDAFDDAVLASVGGGGMEWPIVIQDRILTPDGLSFDYLAGVPNAGDYARPEYMGNTIFINGRPVPTLSPDRRAYRLRVLNGSNARTYAFALCDADALANKSGRIWYTDCLRVIGTEGGLISQSLPLAATDALVMSPAQRRDIILDLSTLPAGVTNLRLVNLALAYYLEADSKTPEAIYTTFADCVLPPSSASYTASDQKLYGALTGPVATLLKLSVNPATAAQQAAMAPFVPTAQALDAILGSAATDDDFRWNGSQLVPLTGAQFGPNRLVLLISNTEGFPVSTNPADGNGYPGWSDVQMFEMTTGGSGPTWQLPFAVDLTTSKNPLAGGPGAASTYTIARSTFFDMTNEGDIAATGHYPALHTPTIQASAGTCERWYVANIGNEQPTSDTGYPDMHPFHVHLVNFVVTRRWNLVGTSFVPASADPLDGIARQDTLLVPTNTLIEIVVNFPVGYAGDYPYHCHLVEHEDKCMMSSFRVA